MLAAKQAAFIEHYKVGPEIFTVGHNNVQSSIANAHVCIQTGRRKFLCESLFDHSIAASAHGSASGEGESFEANIERVMQSLCEVTTKMGGSFPRRLLTIGAHHGKDYEPASTVKSRGEDLHSHDVLLEGQESDDIDDHAEEILAASAKKLAPVTPRRPATQSAKVRFDPAVSVDDDSVNAGKKDPLMGSKHATPSLSLDARYSFTSKLPVNMRKTLDRMQPLEHLFESRVGSFERYVAFLVMFHAMAEKASKPWLLRAWDISKSQSSLRVATTACPVSVDVYSGEMNSSEHKILDVSGAKIPDPSKHAIAANIKRVSSYSDFRNMSDHFPSTSVSEKEDYAKPLARGGVKKQGSPDVATGAKPSDRRPSSSLISKRDTPNFNRTLIVASEADLGGKL